MKILVASLLLFSMSGCATDDAIVRREKAEPFTVHLPPHALHFDLPEEIVRTLSPLSIEKRVDLAVDPFYARDGFRLLGSKTYWFQGPIWVGNVGSFRFQFLVVRRDSKIVGDIRTIDGLADYLRMWRKDRGPSKRGTLQISGSPWIIESSDSFGTAASDPEDFLLLSCPIDQTMFLEVTFSITAYVPDRDQSWRRAAERMRDLIKTSLIFEKKEPNQPPEPTRSVGP